METINKHPNLFKIFVAVFTVNCLITIFKAGYTFGHWLFDKGF